MRSAGAQLVNFDHLGMFESGDSQVRDLAVAAGDLGPGVYPENNIGCVDGNCGSIDTGCHNNIGYCLDIDAFCF